MESEKSPSKEIPNPLHDRVLEAMLEYREKQNRFVFWVRQRNKNNRLNVGVWFQGTEDYAHVGLYKPSSGDLSTKSVGIVFWPLENGGIGSSFRILYKDESRPAVLKFYDSMVSLLKADFKDRLRPKGGRRFDITIDKSGNPFDATFNFLNKYKPQWDQIVIDNNLQNYLFIEETKFSKYLNRISVRRNLLLTAEKGFDDSIIDEEELELEQEEASDFFQEFAKYKHIMASKMKPVIGVTKLAEELSDFLIRLKGESPILFGLFGRWGRGKTFLFEQIWKIEATQENFYRVNFHAWKHQKTPASWGYMYEAFADVYFGKSNVFVKTWKVINLNFKRNKNREFYILLGIVLLSCVGAFLEPVTNFIKKLAWWEQLAGVIGVSLIPALSKLLKIWRSNSTKAKELYKKYSDRHSYSDLLGIQAEVQNELKTLLKVWIREKPKSFKRFYFAWKWGICPWVRLETIECSIRIEKRILFFVDDVDRCSEDRIIDVVDSLRVMLEDPEIAKRVTVVVAVDERILRRAIRLKYHKLLLGETDKKVKLNQLTREYLDKLFLSGVKLGDLSSDERKSIFQALTSDKVEVILNELKSPEYSDSGVSIAGNDYEENLLKQEDIKPIPDSETYEADKSDIQSIATFEISKDEENILSTNISKLNGLTPRQIRIYYLRYLLARDFLKSLKSLTNWGKEEATILSDLLSFIQSKDLIDSDMENIFKEFIGSSKGNTYLSIFKIEDKIYRQFVEVLDLVAPY